MRWIYYVACLLAVVVLESLPRLLIETSRPFMIVERAVLLVVFLAVAWFFHVALHAQWRWSIVSSMFFVDSLAAIATTVLLFLQLFSPWFAVGTGIVLLLRAGVFSYLATDRISHLRGLVFFACFILLVAAEIIFIFGAKPF